jgi:hypothetical protein
LPAGRLVTQNMADFLTGGTTKLFADPQFPADNSYQ